REGAERARAFGVHAALRDHFTIKVSQFFQEPDILQQRRAIRAGGLDVLVIDYGGAECGRQFVAHARVSTDRTRHRSSRASALLQVERLKSGCDGIHAARRLWRGPTAKAGCPARGRPRRKTAGNNATCGRSADPVAPRTAARLS
nr:hypothetical protein [Tanacetum cinerariifolium]